jgi:hypothetical protein
MTRIKKYDEFVNEEIDLKKALASAALGASLAFGNPSVAQTQEPVKTEISISQTQEDFLQVVNVDSTMKKEDIQKKIVNQLYSSPTVRMTSNTPGKIVCNVNFNSKPDYSNGRAYGTMTVEFKDGRYKEQKIRLNAECVKPNIDILKNDISITNDNISLFIRRQSSL